MKLHNSKLNNNIMIKDLKEGELAVITGKHYSDLTTEVGNIIQVVPDKGCIILGTRRYWGNIEDNETPVRLLLEGELVVV